MQIGYCKEFLSWSIVRANDEGPTLAMSVSKLFMLAKLCYYNSGDDTTLIDRLVDWLIDWLIDWSIDWRGKIEEQEKSIFLNLSHRSICVVHSGCKEYVAGCRNISCEGNIYQPNELNVIQQWWPPPTLV